MKKILLSLGLMATVGLSANADSLGNPSIVGGTLLLNLSDLAITWNLQEIEFTNPTTYPGLDLTFSATPITIKSDDGKFTSQGTVALTTLGGQLLGSGEDDLNSLNGIQVYMWDPDVINPSTYLPLTGNFTITIPEGLVKDVESGETNETANLQVRVMEENYSGANISPTPGQTYLASELSEVTLSWKNNGADLCSLEYGQGNITYRDANDGSTSVDGGSDATIHILPEANYKFDGTKLILDLSIITTPGQYDFFIPSTFVIMNGTMLSAETTFNYTIADLPTMAQAQQLTSSPSVEKTLLFKFDDVVSLSDDGFSASFSVNDYHMNNAVEIPDNALAIYEDVLLEEPAEKGQYVSIDLSDFIVAEDYENVIYVFIPEGMFVNEEGAVNVAQTFQFVYMGLEDSGAVTGINSTVANAPVYNLQGVKVAESLNGLSKGIYIINGKKVAIK